jgi:FkbM family methyltransferase
LIRKEIDIPSEKLGSDYGGWIVAFHLLEKAERPIVLSFGLGDDISFDRDIAEKYRAQVYGFDPTEESLAWISAQTLPSGMQVFPIGISNFDGKQTFSLPPAESRGNFSTKASNGRIAEYAVRTYSTIVAQLKLQQVDVLKLDIEGAEYDVIPNVLNSPIQPAQFLIEFHHRMHSISIMETIEAVRLIRSSGYVLFDVSPGGREFSFALASRAEAAGFA